MDQPETMNTCACGCGEPTKGKWKRGHAGRGEGGGASLRPLPGPDAPEWAEDVGIIDVEGPGPEPGPSLSGGPGAEDPPGPPPAPPADEPPAHARRDWHTKASKAAKGKPPRITVSVRADINAKIRFALMVPAQVWAAKDPLCGGTAVEQVPEAADAFTDIVCDSADLVAFFTGPGGNFMKILKVGAALMPVLQMAMAHHVYHSVEIGQEPEAADTGRYAA